MFLQCFYPIVLGPEADRREALQQSDDETPDDDWVMLGEPFEALLPGEPMAGPSGLQPPADPASNPNLREPVRFNNLLLGDSWGGNTNRDVRRKMESIGLQFLQILEGTTNILQSLDLSFFRQYKAFIRRVFLHLGLEGRTDVAITRDGSINLH